MIKIYFDVPIVIAGVFFHQKLSTTRGEKELRVVINILHNMSERKIIN